MAIDEDRAIRSVATLGLLGAGLGAMFGGGAAMAGVAALTTGGTVIGTTTGGFATVIGAALGAIIGVSTTPHYAVVEQVRQSNEERMR